MVVTLTTTARVEKAMKNHLTRPMRGKLACVKTWSISASDAERLRLGAESELDVEDGAGHDQRREQVRQDADAQRDGEATHRAGPVAVKEKTRDERGAVAVDDGVERLVEAGVDRGLDRPPETQLLADALEHQDVGVHRHADGEREAGDSGERQGR